MKIAIVGSGIAGLTAYYYLSKKHQVTLFEKDSWLGGHTHTIPLEQKGKTYNIDTGFIVFNNKTYPNFQKLLNELNVSYKATEMSFSVQCQTTTLEYSSKSLAAFFALKRNYLKLQHWKFLLEIMRFNRLGKAFLHNSNTTELSIGQFLEQYRFSVYFCQYYLIAMTASIWSMPTEQTLEFPALFLLKFLDNHGLLSISKQPTWYVVENGSKSYVEKLQQQSKGSIHSNTAVEKIERHSKQVVIKTKTDEATFDCVVIATHSDQAHALLAKPTELETRLLTNMPYQNNQIYLHQDASLMPKKKNAWASWNYHLSNESNKMASLTYDMKRLQGLAETDPDFFVSMNPNKDIDENKILAQFEYAHPVYNKGSVKAQQSYDELLQQNNRSFFCGAYWGNGFHEDGVASGLKVVKAIENYYE